MVQNFSFEKTLIDGVLIVNPFVSGDIRGSFIKDYSKEVFEDAGIRYDLKEIFYSFSVKGVIRGLHFQRIKHQPKLVRCISGHILDAVVDLRIDSPTFKKWISFDLTGENYKAVLVPPGCAHGFLAVKHSMVSYKCAERFFKEYDSGIRWDDSDIGIDWPLELVGGRENLIISEKDTNLKSFRELMENYDEF